MAKITAKDTSVMAVSVDANDCICLTDTVRYRSDESNAAIGNRLCNWNTIEYLGI